MTGRRWAGYVLAAGVLVAGLPGRAEAARSVTDACPPDKVAEDGFTDTGADGSRDEAAIDCIAAYGVTLGKTATSYDPAGPVQRQQMATFVMRVYDLAKGSSRPTASGDRFPDDGGTHEPNINDAAALGIVRGYPNGRFGPADAVRRDQMAAFVVRLLTTTGVALPADPPDAFRDDEGNTHESAIDVLASFDIVEGVTAGSYGPDRFVTRAQMALFLTRTLDLLVDQGRVDPVGTIVRFAVSGGRTATAFNTTRTCAATVPAGTVVDLALLPADHVTATAGGAARFLDADGDNRADMPAVAPEITGVDGDSTKAGDRVLDVTSDGSVTVALSETTTPSAVVLVVWADPATGDGRLDLVPSSGGGQAKAAAESFGVGCETVFGPPEAPAGASNPTVATVDRGLDVFTSTAGLTYFYDQADTFRIGGSAAQPAVFEGVLSPGDVLSVTYDPGGSVPSVFNITTDDVRAASAVVATVFNADNGATSNDVRVTFVPNPVNGPATVYEIQRGRVVTVICAAGGPPPIQWEPVEAVDKNVGDGCYQYRVVSKNPHPSTSQATSDPSAAVETPDRTPPTLLDARLLTDAGAAGVLDTGDVHRFTFDEPMHTSSDEEGAFYRVHTGPADSPDEVDIRCALDGTTCTLNAAALTIGGTTHGPRTVLTVTIGNPSAVAGFGTTVTYPTTLIGAKGITDDGGNELDPARAGGDNRIDGESG